ncbi:MAG TPA: SIMPL domain-containing protein [Candidatus Acidoferrales bacterium]|nr:SIMPL domain-containing protein [Candidatus Acidoferrales bacterium]
MTAYQRLTLAVLALGFAVVAVAVSARPVVIAASGATVVAPAPAGAGITTYGEATVKVKPDIAILNLGMTASSASAAEAQKQVAERVNHVLQAARDLGIQDRDVKTFGYSLHPTYQPNSYPKISGFVASEQLSFTLREVSRVGKALDVLAGDAGATNASIQFGLADRKPAQAEARVQAISEARAKADAMAKAGGVRVGRLLSVTDLQQGGYPGPLYGAAAPASRDTVVPAGDLEVAIRVQVQFAIS